MTARQPKHVHNYFILHGLHYANGYTWSFKQWFNQPITWQQHSAAKATRKTAAKAKVTQITTLYIRATTAERPIRFLSLSLCKNKNLMLQSEQIDEDSENSRRHIFLYTWLNNFMKRPVSGCNSSSGCECSECRYYTGCCVCTSACVKAWDIWVWKATCTYVG